MLTDRHSTTVRAIAQRLAAELERVQGCSESGETTITVGYRDGNVNRVQVTTTENVPVVKGA
jgi:hypothetical protein